eukprot:gnl/MRDRNA2_/MRDRNA2_91872_c0_seq1.p1 gnl/MRDRNA2_/MRDRNA2_91872_c0~~gnl/MRDRNA2_/MRDRNA2_91872_c0_seq1.p1  ORF type:complete len:1150 (+),score=221.56 gnl/MRDRNA2_/MRDRNA2_91872_c0_seq1:69-3518(+)
MGKKAKAKAGPSSKGPPSKRPRIEVPLPILPPEWKRPTNTICSNSPLRFFLVDIVDAGEEQVGDGPEACILRLHGVMFDGVSVVVTVHGFFPYLFARIPQDLQTYAGLEEAVRVALEAEFPSKKGGQEEQRIVGVERVEKFPLLGYLKDPVSFLKISLASPKLLASCAKQIERGFALKAPSQGGDTFFSGQVFEANVPFALRFLVDTDLGGGRWVELKEHTVKGASNESGQVEIETRVSAVQAVPQDQLEGSRLAPLRMLAMEVKLDTDDRVVAAAGNLRVHNEEGEPRVRVAWVLAPRKESAEESELNKFKRGGTDKASAAFGAKSSAPPPAPPASTGVDSFLSSFAFGASQTKAVDGLIITEFTTPSRSTKPAEAQVSTATPVAMDVDDSKTQDTADLVQPHTSRRVFTFHDEEDLLAAVADFIRKTDPDIILVHDMARSLGSLLQRGRPGPNRVLGRVAGVEGKLSKDGIVLGVEGRLVFDLFTQIQTSHKLTSYSLSSLVDQLLGATTIELGRSTLKNLANDPSNDKANEETLADCALGHAEAVLQIFEKLHYLYNFVEMARVTGVPIDYLLFRGQMVKVQSQLLRKARAEGFLFPAKPSHGSDERSFEGGFVMDPKCGFYRAPIATLDFASLYPSIMMAHNICYSTLLSGGQTPSEFSESPAVDDAGRPHRFAAESVRKGLLPMVLQELLAARKVAKNQLKECKDPQLSLVLNSRQLALKVSANSVYGVTGAISGLLPCFPVAASVTAHGRAMIQLTKKKVEEHFSIANGYAHDAEVIYGDTDSVFVRFGPEGMAMEDAMRLGAEAASLCSGEFKSPIKLEFEKVFRPLLLMNKKRYTGLPFTSPEKPGALSTIGIETVRRDWSGLVRSVLDKTLNLLLRADGEDGREDAAAYVRSVVDELRQGSIDARDLVLSKSLGKGDRAEDYGNKVAHVELAEKIRKRDPQLAPKSGDRVSYVLVTGPAKAKVYEKVEDPLYALQNNLTIDSEHYVEHQLKQPLIRIFEHVCKNPQAAEQLLFPESARRVVQSSGGGTGMGAFFKPKPKCLACNRAVVTSEAEAFCKECAAKPGCVEEVKSSKVALARSLRNEQEELQQKCLKCFSRSEYTQVHRECINVDCSTVFRRPKLSAELETVCKALGRLKVDDW